MPSIGVPVGVRRLLGLGVALTLAGVLGLAFTIDDQAAAGVVRWLFVPLYGLGAACLVAAGLWWALLWTRRRDD